MWGCLYIREMEVSCVVWVPPLQDVITSSWAKLIERMLGVHMILQQHYNEYTSLMEERRSAK